ncbi:MAG: EAL domain-containing protein [Gammaproteobacteria bacterium]|nr:EAL domain-containing protein [Gammaproteobacteria bacterium]
MYKFLNKIDPESIRSNISLPVKITGIVFWGMVLVGLLLSVYLMNSREQELVSHYKVDIIILTHELESILESATDEHDFEHIKRLADKKFIEISNDTYIKAVEFIYSGYIYQLGTKVENLEYFEKEFAIGEEKIKLGIYMPGLDYSLSELRKTMVLSIAGLVFLFGLILQQILQRILSKPFIKMVAVADEFAKGSDIVRFDEQRQDEFGYLAKFINRALDSASKQKQELEESRNALFKEKERAEVTLYSIADGVITTSAEGHIQYMNPMAEVISGWKSEQARDMALSRVVRLVDEESGDVVINPIEKCLQDNVVEQLEQHASLLRFDGEAVAIEASAAPMRNATGELIGAVMIIQDVSHARHLTKQLSYQASHDVLTGLYNRRMFEEYLKSVLNNVEYDDHQHALCYLDLDQFKVINDTCGHMAGDELLRQLAVLLKDSVRDTDTLGRLGGDEFGLLLEDCSIKDAIIIAEKVRQNVKDFRFVWYEQSFEIGVSIGLVAIHADNMEISNLLSEVDVACYAAKEMGRNRVHVYEPTDELLAERHGQMHWATRVNDAFDDNRLVLFKQLIQSIDTTDTGHYEILIRMQDEAGGFVRPDVFIPAAERYNLMPKIDRWVIHTVFSKIMLGSKTNPGDVIYAINLSGTSLADDQLLQYVLDTAEEFDVALENICFEITETAAITNLSKAVVFLKALKKQGCLFSLDDFGSGLSSFAYLKNLPVDYVKIDGAFVKDMLNDPVDRAMVEAITRLGHVMNIETIAEWVEDEATLQLLSDIGVGYAQGYHLGRPELIQYDN